MTEKQMTELFAVMMLAWPGAEMFKGGIPKLGSTIELWTARTRDIDFWVGQQAVGRLCDTSKFPPTIAEFREQAAAVEAKIRENVNHVFDEIKVAEHLGKGVDDWYRRLPANSVIKATVDAMGGTSKLTAENGLVWNYALFEETYNRLIRVRDEMPLPMHSGRYLPQGRGQT